MRRAEVTPPIDPVVVLLGQDGIDEAVRKSWAGKVPMEPGTSAWRAPARDDGGLRSGAERRGRGRRG